METLLTQLMVGSSSPDQTSQWVENIPDVSQMYECKSYDELSKIVNDWINGSFDQESSSSSSSNSTQPSKTSPDTGSQKYKSLDDAFADLIDD